MIGEYSASFAISAISSVVPSASFLAIFNSCTDGDLLQDYEGDEKSFTMIQYHSESNSSIPSRIP